MPRLIDLTDVTLRKRLGEKDADASSGELFQLAQRIALSPNWRTIIIGVGGNGVQTVLDIKSMFINKFKDWEQRVSLLAIDTDMNELTSQRLEPAEKFELICGGKANDRWHNPDMRIPEVKRWVNPDFTADMQSRDGSGQKRHVSKAKLHDFEVRASHNDDKLSAQINSRYQRIQNAGGSLQVFIILGVAGGTGSGLIVDIAALVRRSLSGIGEAFKIVGFFYMPDTVQEFFTHDANSRASTTTNGYAALKELDYYISVNQRGNSFEDKVYFSSDQHLPPITIKESEPLYDMPVLVSDNKQNANRRARTAITESVINLIAAGQSDDQDGNNAFFMTSFMSNSSKLRETFLSTAQDSVSNLRLEDSFNYSAIGVASASIPENTIISYAIGDMVNLALRPEKSLRASAVGFKGFANSPMTEEEAKQFLDEMIINGVRSMESEVRRLCKFNRDGYTNLTLEQIRLGQTDEALISLSFEQRKVSIIKDMDTYLNAKKATFMTQARSFLKEHGIKRFVFMRDGVLLGGSLYANGGLRKRLNDVKTYSNFARVQRRQDDLTQARERCNPNPVHALPGMKAQHEGKWNDAFIDLQTELIVAEAIKYLFGTGGNIGAVERDYIAPLLVFMDQVEDFDRACDEIVDIYEFLGRSFTDRTVFLNDGDGNPVNYNIISSESAYKWAMDLTHMAIDADKLLQFKEGLVDSFMDNPSEWVKPVGARPNDIIPARLNFDRIIGKVNLVHELDRSLTLQAYIDYVVSLGEKTIGQIVDEIIRSTVDRAKPLYNMNPSTTYGQPKSYMLIPNTFTGEKGAEIEQEFKNIAANRNIDVFTSSVSDKIVCYNMRYVLPLYSLNDLDEWETYYDGASRNWLHSNESNKGFYNSEKGLRWEDYPALTIKPNARDLVDNRTLSREGRFLRNILDPLFEEALAMGVIWREKDANGYYYRYVRFPEEAPENMRNNGWSYQIDMDMYNIRDENDMLKTGRDLFEYIVRQNSTTEQRELNDITYTIKLENAGRFGDPRPDPVMALDIAKRTVRRNVQMFIAIKTSVRMMEPLATKVDALNVDKRDALMRQAAAKLICFGVLFKDGISWKINDYPTRGRECGVAIMKAINMTSDPLKAALFKEKDPSMEYVILTMCYAEFIKAQQSNSASAELESRADKTLRDIADGKLSPVAYEVKLRALKDEADAFLSMYKDGSYQERKQLSDRLNFRNESDFNDWFKVAVVSYEKFIETYELLL